MALDRLFRSICFCLRLCFIGKFSDAEITEYIRFQVYVSHFKNFFGMGPRKPMIFWFTLLSAFQ